MWSLEQLFLLLMLGIGYGKIHIVSQQLCKAVIGSTVSFASVFMTILRIITSSKGFNQTRLICTPLIASAWFLTGRAWIGILMLTLVFHP